MDGIMCIFVGIVAVLMVIAVIITIFPKDDYACDNCGWNQGLNKADRVYTDTTYLKGMSHEQYDYFCPVCKTLICSS